MEENLKKEKYSISELESLLRQKNAFSVADVEFAYLEPKGDLSVLLKKENLPLSPKDINLKTASEKIPQTGDVDRSHCKRRYGSSRKESKLAANRTRETRSPLRKCLYGPSGLIRRING